MAPPVFPGSYILQIKYTLLLLTHLKIGKIIPKLLHNSKHNFIGPGIFLGGDVKAPYLIYYNPIAEPHTMQFNNANFGGSQYSQAATLNNKVEISLKNC